MKLVEKMIVWTCEPTIECGYDVRLHEPRAVRLSCRNDIWYGHGFDEATGEIDNDANATCFIKPFNCFETAQEANKAYEVYIETEIRALQSGLDDFRSRVCTNGGSNEAHGI